jgi:hypothetical protein
VRHLDEGNKESDAAYDFTKPFVVHGLHYVVIATKRVTSLDLSRIIGRCQHDHREGAQGGITLDTFEDLNPVEFGHANIKQQQVWVASLTAVGMAPLIEEIEDLLPVGESLNGIVQGSPAQVSLDETGVPLVIIRNENGHFPGEHGRFRLVGGVRQSHEERASLIGRGLNPDSSAEPLNDPLGDRQPEPFTRATIGVQAMKEFESLSLMGRGNPLPVVPDLINDIITANPAGDDDAQRPVRFAVFHRIVDQVAEHLIDLNLVSIVPPDS